MRRPGRKSLSSGSRLATVIALVLGAGTLFTDIELPTLADFKFSTPTVPALASAAVWHAHAYYGTSRRVARRTSRRTAARWSGGGYYGGAYGAGYAQPVATPPASCTTVVSGGGAAQQCTPYMSGSTVVYAP